MQASVFLPYLGCSEQDADLSSLLATIGYDASKLAGQAQRNSGYAFCELKSEGLDLAFYFSTVYEPRFGAPRDGGKAILCCVSVYPNGRTSEKKKPYEEPVPFSGMPVRTRDEALRAFGDPYETQEDDGDIDLDHWSKDGLQIGASYRSDLTIDHIGFSLPSIGRRG